MNSLAVPFGLIGYFAGILLYLFLIGVVLERRRHSRLGPPLVFLLISLLVWYACNFLSLLLRQMDLSRVSPLLAVVEILGFGTLALMPGLLFHTHWRYLADRFSIENWERALSRTVLVALYGPLFFLPTALRSLHPPGPGSPVEKLELFTLPFLILLALSYVSTAWLCRRLVRTAQRETEKSLFSKLFLLFVSIPVFNFLVFLVPALQGREWADYLTLMAFSSSLLPTLLVAYYIYRYGFLQIVIHRGIALILLALLSLGLYLVAIRRLVLYLKDELSAPALLVEGVFVVAILLLLAPLSRWLDSYVQTSFRVELGRYQNLAANLNSIDVISVDEQVLKELIEDTLRRELGAMQVRISLSGAEAQSTGKHQLPLLAGNKKLGFLNVVPSGNDFPSLHLDALRIVAREVASLFERSRLLHAKLETEKELARKSHLAQLGTMAATVAHNVKNPLSSMKTLLQLLSESPNLNADQGSDIDKVVEEIDRLSQTVSSLLEFSGLEEPQAVSQSEVDLSRLVASVAGVFEGNFRSRKVKLKTLFEPARPRVESDEPLLRDILTNLLANAVEASDPGGEIVISVAADHHHLTLAVEDQGEGVPERLRKSIFLPFFSTKSRGTGLGLAIVRKRVEQLGGEIRLESSQRSTGARFVVRIPLQVPSRMQVTDNAHTDRGR